MIAVLLSLLAGMTTPTQSSINSGLRVRVKSPYIATMVSFAVAVVLTFAITMLSIGNINIPYDRILEYPFWIWGGGICGVAIVILNILCLPKLGSANLIMLLSFGQIMTSIIIDNFGLFGARVIHLSVARIIGALIVISGVICMSYFGKTTGVKSGNNRKSKSKGQKSGEVIFIIGALACGAVCAIQVAINGTLGRLTYSFLHTTLISMMVGLISTIILMMAIVIFKGKNEIFDKNIYAIDKPKFKWWMLLGGVCAFIIIASNVIAAPVIGTGMVTVMNLVGQMSGGIIIDSTGFLGIEKKPLTVNKVVGICLMIVGTAVIVLL